MNDGLDFDLKAELVSLEDEIIAWRRHFHQYPEASLKEYETIKTIKEELDKLDVPYEAVGETGAIGTIKGKQGSGKTIVLRADIDALELEDRTGTPYASKNAGLNHACGHDGHTAILLAVAKILKKYDNTFAGTIKLAFQQAEEIGAGARQFVSGGFLDKADQVFGLHLDSSVPSGKLVATPGATNASCDIFYIDVHGLSSHVGKPDLGRDAVLAAASIVVELQKIVAREMNPLDPVVVGIGLLQAGSRYNIVASHAHIEGTVRTLSHENRAFALQRVEEIANSIAAAHRTTIDFRVHDAAAPLINDPDATLRAQKVAAQIAGPENVICDQPQSMGADDFADFLAVSQGVYGRVGTRNLNDQGQTHYSHHHEQFNIDESALKYGAEYHIRYALDFLKD